MGNDPDDPTSCGKDPVSGEYVVGYSELVSLVFTVLCIGGQLKIFVCRVGQRVFFRGAPPSLPLLLSSAFCWLVTLLIAALVDRNIGLLTPIQVATDIDSAAAAAFSMPVAWHRLPPKMVGYAIAICAVLFLIEDFSKVLYYFVIGAYDSPLAPFRNKADALPDQHQEEFLNRIEMARTNTSEFLDGSHRSRRAT